MKYLLITRPQEESERFARLVKLKDYEPVIEPLLSSAYLEDLILIPSKVQAIIVTSKNTLRSIEASHQTSLFHNVPFICVGEKTAESARELGLETIDATLEDVDQLIGWIQENVVPEIGPLMYLHGDVVAKDLKTILEAHKYTVYHQKTYNMNESQIFSQRTVDLLQRQVFHGIVFFSPRTAYTFVNIVKKFGLEVHLAVVNALCLSQSIADEIKGLSWKTIQVAHSPKEDALLELL